MTRVLTWNGLCRAQRQTGVQAALYLPVTTVADLTSAVVCWLARQRMALRLPVLGPQKRTLLHDEAVRENAKVCTPLECCGARRLPLRSCDPVV